jgi:hypothetical protein
MERLKLSLDELTDEEILKEFVKRFQCDGAVLIYLDSNTEYGFARWRNSLGRKWANKLLKALKKDVPDEDQNLIKLKTKVLSLSMSN